MVSEVIKHGATDRPMATMHGGNIVPVALKFGLKPVDIMIVLSTAIPVMEGHGNRHQIQGYPRPPHCTQHPKRLREDWERCLSAANFNDLNNKEH